MPQPSSSSSPPPQLVLLSQSRLAAAPISSSNPGGVAINPAIDLTATISDGDGAASNTVHVWRANDQVVFKHAERSGVEAEAVAWKEDGQFLAVGWGDGVVRLMGLESSKTVHCIKVGEGEGEGRRVGFLAWGKNVTGNRRRRREIKGGVGVEVEVGEGRVVKDVLDLPHELTFLEVEGALPKLGPLPVSGGSGDDMFLFSSTASLDFVFRGCKAEEADDVHVMVVGMEDGGVHLSIYDSFVIGMFRHEVVEGEGAARVCGHSSHPETSTHMLLMRPKVGEGDDGTRVYLVPMDLTFVHYSPVNLSLLASKMTMLQNLLRYVKQTQTHMTNEWKGTRELPQRFLNGVQDDLKKMEGGGLDIVQALCHTVATGHVFAPVKEWLVDIVAERGHKRWDKQVLSGLLSLRGLVHENLIPALERCVIILSRMLGIARFHDSEEGIGFNAGQISRLLDIVSCLTVVAHKILLNVMDELEYFSVFSTWLRLQIDQQASSSSTSEELTEKEATMDHAKVLTYIQRYLTTSPLAMYFDQITKEDYIRDQEYAEDHHTLLQVLEKQLKRQELGQPYMRALPHVDFLVNYLVGRASNVFHNIAEAEKRGVLFGKDVVLSIGEKIWKHDVRLRVKPENGTTGQTSYVALVSEADKSTVFLFKTTVRSTKGISELGLTGACGVSLPVGKSIVDFSFLDESSLLLLCCTAGDNPEYCLIKISYRSSSLLYRQYEPGQRPQSRTLDREDQTLFCTTGFSHLSHFTPVQMEVQKTCRLRGEIAGRVCLIGKDRAMYKTYALPKSWEDADTNSQ
ncbi:anaphase-promoting complex, cyclosome, subunit 4-domain-containing protein [Triangularia verruculosa]|uniref:Anaphase-promoting complex subunit 4 n=1 Tax=Triangularia verruculosa TaxID=2587418 RepID=A0AAN6XPK2_9PEZI|nr:anaphase-promoting complex, cyclosome, subunit 4-domain-containing protein [Triangularia verruculosa]